MDYHRIARLAWPIYGASLLLSTLVLFVGREYNGSKRWLALGPLSFQPAEFAKVAVVIFLARQISESKKRPDSFRFMARTMAMLLPIVGLVGTNNLSTAVIILGIGVILIFVSNPRYLPFVGIGAAGLAFVGIFLSLESYRLERLAIWRNPEAYEKGFQTIQGLYAIGSGGIFGRGLGSSLQKLGFVPEAQKRYDFFHYLRGDRAGGRLPGDSGVCPSDLAADGQRGTRAGSSGGTDLHRDHGTSGNPGDLNIAVVTNTIPNTGITLPFVSYGGTSVLFLMGEMGLALSVSRSAAGKRK